MRLSEERVTKNLLSWLELNGWLIISYDFPQSGSGISIHPNLALRSSKNKGDIIPDIIATKKNIVIFFENKDKFVLSDFIKQYDLKFKGEYSESISKLLKKYSYDYIFYGVGLPCTTSIKERIKSNIHMIDFALCTNFAGDVSIIYDSTSIFST